MAGMYAYITAAKASENCSKRQVLCHWRQGFYQKRICPKSKHFFDTIEITGVDASQPETAEIKIHSSTHPDAVRISFNELTTLAEVQEVLRIFGIDTKEACKPGNPAFMERKEAALRAIFSTYHSETEMMRTSKPWKQGIFPGTLHDSARFLHDETNAAAEMMPLSQPEWDAIHPFAPSGR